MKKSIHIVWIFILLFISGFKGNGSRLGKVVQDFKLRDTRDSVISFSKFISAKGFIVVFTCNHCPFARLYSNRLNALSMKYSPLGVPLLAVNSMDSAVYEEESFEAMQRKVKSDSFQFPYLFDAMQTVGKNFGADHTPQAFVVWKVNNKWIIKYSGSIDDNGKEPEKATPFLANAVDQLLQGKPVIKEETESVGCKIFYR